MLASFSVLPLGVGEKLGGYVAGIVSLIEESGLDYRFGAMQTTIEGDPEEVIALIMKCHREMRKIAPRVLTSIKIDDREEGSGRITGKVEDVEKVLGRKLKKE